MVQARKPTIVLYTLELGTSGGMQRRRKLQEKLLEVGEGSSTADTVKWAFVRHAEQDPELQDG